MFALDALVLAKRRVRDATYVVTLFTREFGRVKAFCQERKSRPLDVGQLVWAQVESKAGTNRIREYHAKGGVKYAGLPYVDMEAGLSYLALLDLLAPEGAPNPAAYDDATSAMGALSTPQAARASGALLRLKLTVSYGICRGAPDPQVTAFMADLRERRGKLRDVRLEPAVLSAVARHVDDSVDAFMSRA